MNDGALHTVEFMVKQLPDQEQGHHQLKIHSVSRSKASSEVLRQAVPGPRFESRCPSNGQSQFSVAASPRDAGECTGKIDAQLVMVRRQYDRVDHGAHLLHPGPRRSRALCASRRPCAGRARADWGGAGAAGDRARQSSCRCSSLERYPGNRAHGRGVGTRLSRSRMRYPWHILFLTCGSGGSV
jgi:hypothetical protein